MFQNVVGQRKKFAIHALRPPIKKIATKKQANQNRAKDSQTKNSTSPKNFDLSYMIKRWNKKQKIVKKALKTTYFWGPGGVPL